ncbi:sodium-coupled monocarboxylate transporter 1-like [Acanthaster planci]|uniref:Sodium-coupled monocarboxylate transporter 1-like n=1 Tax=Acanthaster planci TaxID=133434 RepID=A0A8B7ZAE1_ACAPL|nr:sodium-coupled monocarboxylate transporter 1-like [Acanthaster planci]
MVELGPTFHWADYLIFTCMLATSAGIGVFYAVRSRSQNSSGEYMLASRQMSFFPVAMSLLASLFTGVFIQGSVAETYYRGAILLIGSIIPLVISGTISGRIFMPKFYEMKLTSVYQYLDLRFNVPVRNCCLLIGYLYMILHSGVATYAASVVLTTVTRGKLSVLLSAVILSVVCTFYTVIGGIKAVLWADCFQMLLIFASLLAAVLQGAVTLGYTEIWNLNLEGGRLNLFEFNPDPRLYASFWTVFIGGTFSWLPTMAVLQYQVQRYLTCKSQKTAHMSFGTFIAGCIAVTILCVLAGMALYARYADCDPFSSGSLPIKDGLLPYYILDAFKDLPGVPGLFVSGLCSAALSTTSSILNSIATITGEHVITKIWKDLPDMKYLFITKMLALFFGALNIGTVLLVSAFGELLPALIGIIGVTNGPVCAVFILGFFFRRANAKGTLVGFITGIAVGFWLFIGSVFYQPPIPSLSLSTEDCPDVMTNTSVIVTTMTMDFVNVTAAVSLPQASSSSIVELYKVSRIWYPTICILTVLIVGIVASLIFDAFFDRPKVDSLLLWNWRKSCCCCLTSPATVDDEKSLFGITSDIMSDITVENGEPAGVANPACVGCEVCKSPSRTTHL